MQTGCYDAKKLRWTMDEKTAKIKQSGSAEVVCWRYNTDMTLDDIIGYRMLVIEAIQLTADSHVENIEMM